MNEWIIDPSISQSQVRFPGLVLSKDWGTLDIEFVGPLVMTLKWDLVLILWFPSAQKKIPGLNMRYAHLDSSPVRVLVDNRGCGDTTLINDIFVPLDANAISSMHLPSPGKPDKLMWCPSRYDKFSVKFAYKQICCDAPHSSINSPSANFKWKDWWKSKLPLRLLLGATLEMITCLSEEG